MGVSRCQVISKGAANRVPRDRHPGRHSWSETEAFPCGKHFGWLRGLLDLTWVWSAPRPHTGQASYC